MKKLLLIFSLLFLSFVPLRSQEFDVIAENDRISINISAAGWLAAFENGTHFYIKGYEGSSIMYAAGLWLSAKTEGGLSQCVVHSLVSPLDMSFTTGVLDSSFDDWSLDIFQKVYPVTREEINLHILDWEDNGIIDQVPAENLLGWPVASNPNFSDIHSGNFPSTFDGVLAPFFDRNNDGIYDVYEGDYPLVNGDKAWWCAYSDQSGRNNDYRSDIGSEVHQLAYLFETGNSVIDQSIFFDYTVTNKYHQDWDTMVWGIYSDPDIGSCSENTYVGSIPESGVSYAYSNGVTVCDNYNGVSADVPILSTIAMNDFYSTNYFSINYQEGLPFEQASCDSYSNLLKGHRLSLGGNGYDNGPSHKFIFDGTQIDGIPWTECTNESAAFDRSTVSTFSKSKVVQGASLSAKIALNVKYGIAHPCPDRDLIKDNADIVRQFESSYTDYINNNRKRPIALFDYNITEAFSVKFQDNSLLDVETWLWEFGEQETSNDQSPSFTFSGAGTYKVCLTTTNHEGSDRMCRLIHLNYGLRPVADFTFSVRGSGIVQFRDASTNDPHTLVWDLDARESSQQSVFFHRFTSMENEVEVCLNAINDAGVDKICKVINLETSSAEVEKVEVFSLFPNPTRNGIVNINYSGMISRITTIEITDLLGRVAYETESFNKILNLSHLTEGVYFVHLKQGGVVKHSRNLIISK